MAARQSKIQAITRNPLLMLDMVEELREHAENLEKEAAEGGRSVRSRVLKIRAFAGQLNDAADAKIGDQERKLNESAAR